MTDIQHFYILNLCKQYYPSLHSLYPELQSMYLNVLPLPGFRPMDYLDIVKILVDNGELSIYVFQQKLPKLDALLQLTSLDADFIHNATLRMTASGGERWEQYAKPNWSIFCLTEDTPTEDQELSRGVLASQSLDVIVAYLGWYKQIRNRELLPTTVSINKHVTYKVIYWKELPDVYEAQFDGRIVKSASTPEDCAVDRWLNPWLHSLYDWHIKPWSHPDWPKTEEID